MKNNIKKFTAVMLSAALAVLTAGGCAKKAENKLPATETETSAEAAEETAVPPYDVHEYQSKYALSNKNADDCAKILYDYLCENYGKKIISCQQESTWMGSPDFEMDYIMENTGKLPAMRGLDYMNNDFNGVNARAIEWHKKGGIVTICWHTGIRSSGYNESQKDEPDFEKMLTEGTEEYETLMKSWDKAAKSLQKLRNEGVPVLWRPFHEFDGQWFWWGKGTKEDFIKLWQMMYDKFTNEYELNNLIWVLGYSHVMKEGWYVGDDYCDIIGSDTYDNTTHLKAWNKLLKINTAGKPMALHECGNVPAPEEFEKDGCIWSWFMIWHTDWLLANDKENLKNVYNSDLVITLDELPDFNDQ